MQNLQKNNLVIFYGGIGDILLWIPALKAFDTKPDVVFLYETPELKILQENDLVNRSYHIKNKIKLLLFCQTHLKQYDRVFLNHLCGGSFLLNAVSFCAKEIVSNSAHYHVKSKITKRKILEGVHDSIQNYFLAHEKIPVLKEKDFELEVKNDPQIQLPEKFIAVQLSAGNNKTPYKNWPIKHWIDFFTLAEKKYPSQKFVLLGHADEISLTKELIKNRNITSLIGKTTIDQTFGIIKKSDLFFGLDGGLLHVAVSVNKPTFTIWGGSSPVLYGYAKLLGSKHTETKLNLNCMPCNAWQGANTTKTNNPLLCPDFACLKMLSAEKVFEEFVKVYDMI